MKQPGTILPTAETLAKGDAHAARMARQSERRGDRELAGCEKRVVGGEVRWYDTTDQYAIVARSGKILWFAVTPDGDFRI
jgi:hypothetical protein